MEPEIEAPRVEEEQAVGVVAEFAVVVVVVAAFVVAAAFAAAAFVVAFAAAAAAPPLSGLIASCRLAKERQSLKSTNLRKTPALWNHSRAQRRGPGAQVEEQEGTRETQKRMREEIAPWSDEKANRDRLERLRA